MLNRRLQHLRRAISPRDLQRYLEFYAPRIQELSYYSSVDEEEGYTRFSNDAFLALQLATGMTPGALSPNLRSFSGWLPPHFTGRWDNMFPFLSLFLGKSVTSVYFRIHHPFDPLTISSMQYAVERLPNLEEIKIEPGYEEKGHVIPWLDETLQNTNWEHLKNLTLGLIESPLAFDSLSKLPKLEGLDFLGATLAPSWRKIDIPIDPATPFFPSLRRLELDSQTVVSLDTAIYIIRRLPPTNTLQYLSVPALEAHEALQGVQELVDAITSRLQPSQLQQFHYKSDSWTCYKYPLKGPPLEPFVPAITSKNVDVSQLLSFHQLRVLDLQFTTAAFVLPLGLAVQIPGAWPNLRKFNLKTTRPTRPSIDNERLETILKGYTSPLNVSLQYVEDAAPGNGNPAFLQGADSAPGNADEETDTDSEIDDLEDEVDLNWEGALEYYSDFDWEGDSEDDSDDEDSAEENE